MPFEVCKIKFTRPKIDNNLPKCSTIYFYGLIQCVSYTVTVNWSTIKSVTEKTGLHCHRDQIYLCRLIWLFKRVSMMEK